MDTQSSSINQWTKGSKIDLLSKNKNDSNSRTLCNYNSFEFLDMSSCDEMQKLKLKNTLSSPIPFSTQQERYECSFATRTPAMKHATKQYIPTNNVHTCNSRNRLPSYQMLQPKHPHDKHNISSDLSFSSEGTDCSKNHDGAPNNIVTTMNNITNINDKRQENSRKLLKTQDHLSRWQYSAKKMPYDGIREVTLSNTKDTGVKRNFRLKENPFRNSTPQQGSPGESKHIFSSSKSNMSPPLTNFQTNVSLATTTSPSFQNAVTTSQQAPLSHSSAHYNSQQMPFTSTNMHAQIYSSGNVPLVQHYPLHAGYMSVPSGPSMIQSPHFIQGDRNDGQARDTNLGIHAQNDHQASSSMHQLITSSRGSGGSGRRGRFRGGNNARRDYQVRQSTQNLPSVSTNDFGQTMLDHSPQAANVVSGPAQYHPFYIHHYAPTYYGAANAGTSHLTIPASGNTATAQSLTGQPLFAIQQPLHVYQYGSYPIMYNMISSQQQQIGTQQPENLDGDQSQNQESNSSQTKAVIQMSWPHHTTFPEPQQIFHPTHIHPSELDTEYQVPIPNNYHMQIMNSNNYHIITSPGNLMQPETETNHAEFDEAIKLHISEQDMYQKEDSFFEKVDGTRRTIVGNENDNTSGSNYNPMLVDHQDSNTSTINKPILVETLVPKNQENLAISTTPERVDALNIIELESIKKETSKALCVDNRKIVKREEKLNTSTGNTMPNLSGLKKQTASVSVSAIPNKDAKQLRCENGQFLTPEHKAGNVQELISSFSKVSVNDVTKPDPQFIMLNHTSFSSITAEEKKSENRKANIQPLQKQMALSEQAKQQIVTTITGAVGLNHDYSEKKLNLEEPKVIQTKRFFNDAVENSPQSKLVNISSCTDAPSQATWAGLFNSNESFSGKTATSSLPLPFSAKSTSNLITNSQKGPTAKNDDLLYDQTSRQVPGALSYSAVSAQFVPVSTISAKPLTLNSAACKKLPQSIEKTSSNNSSPHCTTGNQNKITSVDQHAMLLGDFFSKYKLENNSVSLFPRGLLNKSNYCYINAILQALVACPPFYHLMRAIPHMPPSYRNQTKTPVTDAMVELVSNYSQLPFRKWVSREKNKKDDTPDLAIDSAFEPTVILRMLQVFQNDAFPVEGRQEDAEEFLSFILNKMNDEMIELKKLVENPKKPALIEEKDNDINVDTVVNGEEEWQVISGTRNKSTITRTTDFGRSPISDIFGGKLRLRVHREGDHSSDNIEPFFTLKLVIEKSSSVREALDVLVGRDQLEGVTCSRTNQEVAAWQQVTLEELPVVLILHLKCFDFKKESCTKILKTVEFPVELKIDQKIMASKNKYQQKQKQYKLFAVVYHDGKEASKGHYITDVFHVGYSSWIRYDDSTVKPVPENNVLHPKSPRVPYLLYYRRYDTIGGGHKEKDHNCNKYQNNQKSNK